MRPLLFWDIMQPWFSLSFQQFGKTSRSHLQWSSCHAWPLVLEQIVCSTMLVTTNEATRDVGGHCFFDLRLCLRPHGPDASRPELSGPLCCISIYGSLVLLRTFQKTPRHTLNVLWLQGVQIHMSDWSQSFTLTKNVRRVFVYSTPPTQWTVWQPY
jgi:hypothetical protein